MQFQILFPKICTKLSIIFYQIHEAENVYYILKSRFTYYTVAFC